MEHENAIQQHEEKEYAYELAAKMEHEDTAAQPVIEVGEPNTRTTDAQPVINVCEPRAAQPVIEVGEPRMIGRRSAMRRRQGQCGWASFN
ncbi:hypothetical protein LWI28_008780 [Acer negundo]|uniref:Uncharacterized protein n=1 Tax=Acer negundo TaxID=4023 RepID=A0AAD5J3U2_ACENE|nr:hypothetical protein LWI28_008780 [Acer negundo]